MTSHEILSTHVGSLARSAAVMKVVSAAGTDPAARSPADGELLQEAVATCVARQARIGLHVVSDGEMTRPSYVTYMSERLTGIEFDDVPRKLPADIADFPGFSQSRAGAAPSWLRPVCRAPVTYAGEDRLADELTRLGAAVARSGVGRAFVNAPSPGTIAMFQPNEYYQSDEEYLVALADALRHEYTRVIEAGFELQIDAPDLAMGRHTAYQELSPAAYRTLSGLHVEVLNYALRDLPASRMRMHVCWGNYEGPHHRDAPITEIIGAILRSKPAMLLFEAANPRHAHEWTCWSEIPIPADKILIPGVIDTTTNFIEHPELVAERLRHFLKIVGPDRVMAGTDCGFASWAGYGAVHPDICWAKLEAMVRGAQIASYPRYQGE